MDQGGPAAMSRAHADALHSALVGLFFRRVRTLVGLFFRRVLEDPGPVTRETNAER